MKNMIKIVLVMALSGYATLEAAAARSQTKEAAEVNWKEIPTLNDSIAYTTNNGVVTYVHGQDPESELPNGLFYLKDRSYNDEVGDTRPVFLIQNGNIIEKDKTLIKFFNFNGKYVRLGAKNDLFEYDPNKIPDTDATKTKVANVDATDALKIWREEMNKKLNAKKAQPKPAAHASAATGHATAAAAAAAPAARPAAVKSQTITDADTELLMQQDEHFATKLEAYSANPSLDNLTPLKAWIKLTNRRSKITRTSEVAKDQLKLYKSQLEEKNKQLKNRLSTDHPNDWQKLMESFGK